MTSTAVAERQDSHNPAVDADLARSGLCGVIHLATGRRCAQPAHHRGRCTFVHVQSGVGTSVVPSVDRLGCVLGR